MYMYCTCTCTFENWPATCLRILGGASWRSGSSAGRCVQRRRILLRAFLDWRRERERERESKRGERERERRERREREGGEGGREKERDREERDIIQYCTY